jgi:hypothetical protein
MVRGIERRRIFESDRDREDFLDRLGKVVEEGQASCFAWVLIPMRFGDVHKIINKYDAHNGR